MNILFNSFLDLEVGIDTEIVILGDSHIQTAMDPSYFTNAINIAQPAEPYYISYLKLEKVLNAYSGVKHIYLGYGLHNIAPYNDFKLIDDKWSSEMYDRAYSIIPLFEFRHNELINRNELIRSKIRNTCLFPNIKSKPSYFGEYSPKKKSISFDNEHLERRIKNHYYSFNEEKDFCYLNLNYLDSIVGLCKSKNIDLMLIRTPVTKRYYDLVPNYIKLKYDSLAKYYSNDVKYIGSMVFTDSLELFSDFDHLNQNGASWFCEVNFR